MRMLLLALAVACNGSTTPPDDENGTGGEETGTLGPELTDEWMATVVREGRIAEHLSPEGVVWAEHFEEVNEESPDPRTDAEGMVRDARRLCGSDLAEAVERLQRQLAHKLTDLGDDAFSCEGRRCVFVPLMEFDLDARLEFATVDGAFVLKSVVRIDTAAATEEYRQQTDAWAEEALVEAARTRCP